MRLSSIGVLALLIVAAAVVGFLMHPRREVFYVRTTVRLINPDRPQALEHDLLAVKVELVRLWLLFVPTFLAVVFLVFFAAGGPMKFSYLNWLFSSRHAYLAFVLAQYPPLLVFVLLSAWIGERRVMRDAEACSVRSFSIYPARVGELGKFHTCLWVNTENTTAGTVLALGWFNPMNWRQLFFTTFERRN
jgi:hypothetical protein